MHADSPDMTARPANCRAKITNDPRRLAVDGRTAAGRRMRDLLESFIAALGGMGALSESQRADVRRAAELSVLAETARAEALRQAGGGGELAALVKLEGAADRAVRRLGIKPGAGPKPPSLAEHLARRAAERASAAPGEAA